MIHCDKPYTQAELDLYERVRDYTMVSGRGTIFTHRVVKFIEDNSIPGDIVECGVYRGGQIITAALTCRQPRHFWLYDTFTGMSEPGPHDSRKGSHATELTKWRKHTVNHNWCRADYEIVEENIGTVLTRDRYTMIKGDVCETLKTGPWPEKIAFLRLDTDWYESTRAELEVLYPRVSPGGMVVFDDYHSWDGARKAVDEYFAKINLTIDTGGVAFVRKPL